MKQFSSDFLQHMTVALPAKLDALDEQARAVKNNFVLMALFLECANEPGLRATAYDLVLQDRLLDCHPETIAQELPRLVNEAREMLRQQRETELANASAEEAPCTSTK
jgi:hypothetical protein